MAIQSAVEQLASLIVANPSLSDNREVILAREVLSLADQLRQHTARDAAIRERERLDPWLSHHPECLAGGKPISEVKCMCGLDRARASSAKPAKEADDDEVVRQVSEQVEKLKASDRWGAE